MPPLKKHVALSVLHVLHPSRGGDILVHGLSPAPGPQTGTPPSLNNNHRPETALLFTALVLLLWHAF